VEIVVSKKYCDLKRLKNIELMVSDNSGVYMSERNLKSFKGNVCHAKVLNCLSISKVSLISV